MTDGINACSGLRGWTDIPRDLYLNSNVTNVPGSSALYGSVAQVVGICLNVGLSAPKLEDDKFSTVICTPSCARTL